MSLSVVFKGLDRSAGRHVLGRRDVGDGLERTAMAETVKPFPGGVLGVGVECMLMRIATTSN